MTAPPWPPAPISPSSPYGRRHSQRFRHVSRREASIASTEADTELLLERLEARLAGLESAVVAFSGGVDSSLVAALAARALGSRALAVTAVSPALADGELAGAREVAGAVGIGHEVVGTDELRRVGYRRNDRGRCYHCKTELYEVLSA